ncbi:MAG: transposase zinc-binding domain-containing protein [Deltaproteobacteria bacterium]|nr:transposase zinc-binding domain-containing protein [Deltaproteobacteria bacterium]
MSHRPSCPQGSWPRPTFEVADVFRIKGESYNSSHVLTPEQGRLLRDIPACRTAILGGHEDVCDTCGFTRPAYNSCRNRHCLEAAGGEWSTLAGPKWSRALAGKRGEEWSTGLPFRFLAAVR